MNITISIAAQKGGVGKTTLTMNIGGVLSEMQKKTLLIDLDPQCNLSNTMLSNHRTNEKSVFDLIVDGATNVQEVINKTEFPGLDIIPSSPLMTGLEKKLAEELDAQFILKEKIDPIKEDYDFIILDCPPSSGLPTLSSLICSDYIISPMIMDEWSITGSAKLEQYVQKIRKRANPELKNLWYLINRYDVRRNIEKAYLDFVYQNNECVFKTVIKNSVKYPESIVIEKKPINYYLPLSEQANAFRTLVSEILEKCQTRTC